MCGICGIFEPGAERDSLIRRMHEILAHRGPDAASVYRSGNVWLGHRRLSIIDLATGDQPIFNADKTLAIIYNGEIYNYQELRGELEGRGMRFATQSDTEVVLKLYEAEGPDGFRRLNGIFAFAILDEREREPRLVLARDQFGIKPLHYFCQGGRFVFASEQKAILLHPAVERRLNAQALHQHLNLRYTQSDETLFKDLFRLPPGHFMVVRKGHIDEMAPYYHLDYRIDTGRSDGYWLDAIPRALKTAVERQLVADVPIGVYLSGGMDSSSIVAMMRQLGVDEINTFTLGFNEPSDENPDARLIAEHYGTRHRDLRMELNPMRLLPEVVWHAEEPKINLLQGFLMSQFVTEHVKVVLGGLGGDELFSGYDIHRFIYPFNGLHQVVPERLEAAVLARFSGLLYRIQQRFGSMATDEYRRGLQMALASGNIAKFYLILRNVWDFDTPHWERIYTPEFRSRGILPVMHQFETLFGDRPGLTPLDQVYRAEWRSKMVNDYLLTEDRMSMAHSVEERVPFLDLDLVRLGFSIPIVLLPPSNL